MIINFDSVTKKIPNNILNYIEEIKKELDNNSIVDHYTKIKEFNDLFSYLKFKDDLVVVFLDDSTISLKVNDFFNVIIKGYFNNATDDSDKTIIRKYYISYFLSIMDTQDCSVSYEFNINQDSISLGVILNHKNNLNNSTNQNLLFYTLPKRYLNITKDDNYDFLEKNLYFSLTQSNTNVYEIKDFIKLTDDINVTEDSLLFKTFSFISKIQEYLD